ILVSSSLVKDVYLNYMNPKASHHLVKWLSISVTGIIGIIVFVMAINPPDLLVWLNLFAFGGLEAAFIWPIVMGLYWKKGNKYGALASMIVGVGLYALSDTFYPEPLGLHSVVLPTVFALVAYVAGSLVTQQRTVSA